MQYRPCASPDAEMGETAVSRPLFRVYVYLPLTKNTFFCKNILTNEFQCDILCDELGFANSFHKPQS